MKIIYGKDICILQGNAISKVIIKYRGNPYLSHKHLEIVNVLNQNQALLQTWLYL